MASQAEGVGAENLPQKAEGSLEDDSRVGGPGQAEQRPLRSVEGPLQERPIRVAKLSPHPTTSPNNPGSSQRVSSPSTTRMDSNFAPADPRARWGSTAKTPWGRSSATSLRKG
jgi:hypothetical protein